MITIWGLTTIIVLWPASLAFVARKAYARGGRNSARAYFAEARRQSLQPTIVAQPFPASLADG